MSEETGREIKAEIDDLNSRFRKFTNGFIAALIAAIGHACFITWHWSAAWTRLETVEKAQATQQEKVSAVHDEQQRRTSLYNSISDIKSELTSLRGIMQGIRDDVLIIKTGNGKQP